MSKSNLNVYQTAKIANFDTLKVSKIPAGNSRTFNYMTDFSTSGQKMNNFLKMEKVRGEKIEYNTVYKKTYLPSKPQQQQTQIHHQTANFWIPNFNHKNSGTD